ncbi:M15 family metallopeptidase [Myceligenerans crystallogenes]|uniref:D-alanyl-D-alanine carboxypeptidase-like core domain-containing protein n=1 Tax=Myceligenerans crystallogenes TaxID=316335 RepID=A0ABP4ZGA5_9MICO
MTATSFPPPPEPAPHGQGRTGASTPGTPQAFPGRSGGLPVRQPGAALPPAGPRPPAPQQPAPQPPPSPWPTPQAPPAPDPGTATWSAPMLTGPARKEPRRRPRRARTGTVVVTVVALLLVGTLGGTYYLLDQEAGDLTAEAGTARTLLEQSDGQVADPATRDTLTRELATADQVLAGTPLLERRPGDAATATENLAAAQAGVVSSMIDQAHTRIADGRHTLTTAIDTGRRTYDATGELDDPARATVKKKLDAATQAAAGTTDDALADADLPTLQEAVTTLGRHHKELTTATGTLATAQDTAVCPQPDQLWSPDSGHLPADQLATIPWAPEFQVRKDILASLVALNTEYKAQFGTDLTINSAYRSYESQVGLAGSPLAAPPGCSSHGLGLAVDLGGGVQTHASPQYTWLTEHAAAHGWAHPRWADPDGRLPEPWHWQHVKSPEETL